MRALIAVVAMLPVLAVAGPIRDAVDACHRDAQFAQHARGAYEHSVGKEAFAVQNIRPDVFPRARLNDAMDLLDIGYNYRIVDAYGYAFARCMKQKSREEPATTSYKLPGE